jgi:hypothetical protein
MPEEDFWAEADLVYIFKEKTPRIVRITRIQKDYKKSV